MAEKKEKRPTDPSVEMDYDHLAIEAEADRVPGEDNDLSGRHSRRLSADLPYGLPTNDNTYTGTPSEDVSSGFSDLRPGEMPHLEDENARKPRGVKGGTPNLPRSNAAVGSGTQNINNEDQVGLGFGQEQSAAAQRGNSLREMEQDVKAARNEATSILRTAQSDQTANTVRERRMANDTNMTNNTNRVDATGDQRSGNRSQSDEQVREQAERQDQYDRPRGEKSRYDAETEMPDPKQVERDNQENERAYGSGSKDKNAA
jgi:hypothetical protein